MRRVDGLVALVSLAVLLFLVRSALAAGGGVCPSSITVSGAGPGGGGMQVNISCPAGPCNGAGTQCVAKTGVNGTPLCVDNRFLGGAPGTFTYYAAQSTTFEMCVCVTPGPDGLFGTSDDVILVTPGADCCEAVKAYIPTGVPGALGNCKAQNAACPAGNVCNSVQAPSNDPLNGHWLAICQ